MAYDKVIDSAVLDNNLTLVAQSIRSKAGTDESLPFPEGFVSAVDNIQVGVDTSDATAASSDILYGKSAYAGGEKVEGEVRYKKYTGEIVSTIVGSDAYASLVTDSLLAEHRDDENLSVVVSFDIAEPIAYTILRNIGFNKADVLPGWGSSQAQYITRYDANSDISTQQTAVFLNNDAPATVGCMQITESGELRLYSLSAANYAIRPCNFTVEVRW